MIWNVCCSDVVCTPGWSNATTSGCPDVEWKIFGILIHRSSCRVASSNLPDVHGRPPTVDGSIQPCLLRTDAPSISLFHYRSGCCRRTANEAGRLKAESVILIHCVNERFWETDFYRCNDALSGELAQKISFVVLERTGATWPRSCAHDVRSKSSNGREKTQHARWTVDDVSENNRQKREECSSVPVSPMM